MAGAAAPTRPPGPLLRRLTGDRCLIGRGARWRRRRAWQTWRVRGASDLEGVRARHSPPDAWCLQAPIAPARAPALVQVPVSIVSAQSGARQVGLGSGTEISGSLARFGVDMRDDLGRLLGKSLGRGPPHAATAAGYQGNFAP